MAENLDEDDSKAPNRTAVLRSKVTAASDKIVGFFRSKTGKITSCVSLLLALVAVLVMTPDTPEEQSPSMTTPNSIASNNSISEPENLPTLSAYATGHEERQQTTVPRGPQKNQDYKIMGPKLVQRVSRLDLPDGASCGGVLMTGAKNGPVKAKLTEDLKSRFGERLLPRETTILGTAQTSGDRLSIQFGKAILPDGDVVKILALALDSSDLTPGIKGSFVTREGLILAGSIALNTLSGVADGLQENESVGLQVAKKNTVRNAALNGASRASMDQAKELTGSFKESARSITVSAGTNIVIMFSEDENGGQN